MFIRIPDLNLIYKLYRVHLCSDRSLMALGFYFFRSLVKIRLRVVLTLIPIPENAANTAENAGIGIWRVLHSMHRSDTILIISRETAPSYFSVSSD